MVGYHLLAQTAQQVKSSISHITSTNQPLDLSLISQAKTLTGEDKKEQTG